MRSKCPRADIGRRSPRTCRLGWPCCDRDRGGGLMPECYRCSFPRIVSLQDSEPQCDVRNATHLVQETERIGVYLFGSEASQWKPDLSVDFQIHAKFACIWKPKTTQGKVTATGVSQMKANASLMASFPLRAYPKTLKSVQKSRQWVPFWQFWDRL